MGETDHQPTSEESLVRNLIETNNALDKAIDDREYEIIQEIVDKRGPMVQALMKHHAHSPINPLKTEQILAQEKTLQAKMKSLQSELGEALGTSQKHAHAQRMYDKFNSKKDVL